MLPYRTDVPRARFTSPACGRGRDREAIRVRGYGYSRELDPLTPTLSRKRREGAPPLPTCMPHEQSGRSMDPRTRTLLEAPILPTLLRLAIPNIVTTTIQGSIGLIDIYFMAKLGTDAVAGVSLVFPGLMLMQMMSGGAMGGGISSAVARALGAGRRDDADAIVLHALVIGAIFAVFFCVAVVAGGPWLYARARRQRRGARRRADLLEHRVRRRDPDLELQRAGEHHARHRQHRDHRRGDGGRRRAARAAVALPDLRLTARSRHSAWPAAPSRCSAITASAPRSTRPICGRGAAWCGRTCSARGCAGRCSTTSSGSARSPR